MVDDLALLPTHTQLQVVPEVDEFLFPVTTLGKIERGTEPWIAELEVVETLPHQPDLFFSEITVVLPFCVVVCLARDARTVLPDGEVEFFGEGGNLLRSPTVMAHLVAEEASFPPTHN